MSEKEKQRRARRDYLKDFQQTASGEYIYSGPLYLFQEDSMRWGQSVALLWALTGIMAAAVVTAGCLPAAGAQSCPYVLLPYAGGLLAVVSVVWLMCRLTAGGNPLKGYIHRATVGQFKVRSTLALAFLSASFLGETLYLALHGAEGLLPGSLAFLAFLGVALGCAYGWRKRFSQLRWSE